MLIRLLLAFAVLLALVAGCHTITADPPAPRTVSTCEETRAVVHVTWHASISTLQEACGGGTRFLAYGCATTLFMNGERHDALHERRAPRRSS